MAIIVAILVGILRAFFLEQVKTLWKHLKTKKEAYGFFLGSMGTIFIIYSIFTVKTQINNITIKLNEYEKLNKNVLSGKVAFDYENFIKILKEKAKSDYLNLKTSMSEINFPSNKTWYENHLTNIFGIISVDKKNKKVYFEYKSVAGKNKFSNKTLYTRDFTEDNPNLFLNTLFLQGNDKKSFLSGAVDKCTDRALKKNLKEMESSDHQYQVCDFKRTFFFTTGRIKGHSQKTFNEINYIYYIAIPYASQGYSSLYFYYAFNSGSDVVFDTRIRDKLEQFLRVVNNYKKKVVEYGQTSSY